MRKYPPFLFPIFFAFSFYWLAKRPVNAFMTVGLTCVKNSTCTGDNEYCYIRRDFETPCEKGLCACLPGYMLDGVRCAKKVQIRNLGDRCDIQNFGQYYGVTNADCYGSVIACSPGYNQRGINSCMSETTCADGRICPAGMYCDSRQRCSCYYDKKFDLATQTCIKRDFGDACRRDTDCQVQGRDFNGFTFRSAGCVDGSCACGDNGQAAVATYIDRATDTYRTKTICVSPTATVNATQSTTCTLDPVYWSDIADTVVCDPGYVCYQCPEDYQYPDYGKNFFGKCRKVLTPPQISAQQAMPVPRMVTEKVPTFSFNNNNNKAEVPLIDLLIQYFTTVAKTEATLPTSTTTSTSTTEAPTTTTRTTPSTSTTTTSSTKLTTTTTYRRAERLTTMPTLISWMMDSDEKYNYLRTSRIYNQQSPTTTISVNAMQVVCTIPRRSANGGLFFAAMPNGSWALVTILDYVLPGTQVNLVCESGFAPNGGSARSVCLLDGQWSEPFGTCSWQPLTTTTLPRAVTVTAQVRTTNIFNCAVPVVLNGALSTNDTNIVDTYMVRPGSLLSLTCNIGYFITNGASESVCLTNGRWWKPLGFCIRNWRKK